MPPLRVFALWCDVNPDTHGGRCYFHRTSKSTHPYQRGRVSISNAA
jgi:hypothetical protein